MKIETLETQVRMLKWLFSGVMTAFTILIIYIYPQSAEIASLKQDVSAHILTDDKQDIRIEKNAEKLNNVSGDIKANKVHLIHIKSSVDEIKDMIKEFYSRRK